MAEQVGNRNPGLGNKGVIENSAGLPRAPGSLPSTGKKSKSWPWHVWLAELHSHWRPGEDKEEAVVLSAFKHWESVGHGRAGGFTSQLLHGCLPPKDALRSGVEASSGAQAVPSASRCTCCQSDNKCCRGKGKLPQSNDGEPFQ